MIEEICGIIERRRDVSHRFEFQRGKGEERWTVNYSGIKRI